MIAELEDASRGMRTHAVAAEVCAERDRQQAKWGEQNHPDGTTPGDFWPGVFRMPLEAAELIAKAQVDLDADRGQSTYLGIFLEEVLEAASETDPAKLRGELIQAAAVAVAWVEAIDRRQAVQ